MFQSDCSIILKHTHINNNTKYSICDTRRLEKRAEQTEAEEEEELLELHLPPLPFYYHYYFYY